MNQHGSLVLKILLFLIALGIGSEISSGEAVKIVSNQEYIFENDKVYQCITIIENTGKAIKFNYVSKNKVKNITQSIAGVAKLKEGDVEIEEDDEGNAFPVTEYVYDENAFRIAFRLESIMGIMKTKSTNVIFSSPDFLRLKNK